MRLKTKFNKEFEGKSYNTNDIWEWLDKNIQIEKLVVPKYAEIFREVKVIYNRENRNNYKDSYKKTFVLYKDLNKTLKEIDMDFQRNTGDKPDGRHYQIIITVSNFSE